MDNICYICGENTVYNEHMTLKFELDGILVIIYNVPGYECNKCHEQIYDADVAKHIEKILDAAEAEVQKMNTLMGKLEYQYAA